MGECKSGLRTCLGDGTLGTECVGQVQPILELCDGKDNDCDGDVDEGLNKRAILVGSGVPGKGLATAPGLEGYFNPKSKAADKAGKKK